MNICYEVQIRFLVYNYPGRHVLWLNILACINTMRCIEPTARLFDLISPPLSCSPYTCNLLVQFQIYWTFTRFIRQCSAWLYHWLNHNSTNHFIYKQVDFILFLLLSKMLFFYLVLIHHNLLVIPVHTNSQTCTKESQDPDPSPVWHIHLTIVHQWSVHFKIILVLYHTWTNLEILKWWIFLVNLQLYE